MGSRRFGSAGGRAGGAPRESPPHRVGEPACEDLGLPPRDRGDGAVTPAHRPLPRALRFRICAGNRSRATASTPSKSLNPFQRFPACQVLAREETRMIPPRFEYFAPSTLDEAVEILGRYGGEAKVLAGGQSLLPVMKLRLAEPKALVDINRIPDLAYIREDGGWLRIGATTRTNDLNDSELIHARYPILSDAAYEIADPLVRNMGTVGGNVSHGDPANDLPACMLALGAHFVVRGPNGSRSIAAHEFYQDTFVTALESNEILLEIEIPKARLGQGNAYVKLEKRIGDFPIVGVAANLVLGTKGTIESEHE